MLLHHTLISVLCLVLRTRITLQQIGQQNLAFGLKFNAKGIVDCYEKELESLPFGQKRDIDFKMIEGDFQLFEGKWSIEQVYSVDETLLGTFCVNCVGFISLKCSH